MNTKLSKYFAPIFLVAGIILLTLILPVPAGLTRSGLYLLGVFLSTILLWMTVGVTWPSVFCILAMGFLPETTLNAVITGAIGNPTITFLIFTFCCSWALERTHFVRRCAVWFLSLPVASRNPWAFMLLYFTSILVLGSFMSTTVIVIIYLTINDEIFSILGLQKGDKVANMMTMGLIIVSGISGAVTPIAHVFPLMAMSLYHTATGATISYLHYMAAAVPVGILSTLAMLLIFRIVLRPKVEILKGLDTDRIRAAIGPADRKERITVAVFLGVCALWILPELLTGILPELSALIKGYGTAMPPMLGAILLCVLTADGTPVMDLKKALAGIPWCSILMGASALALGNQLSSADIGLTDSLTAMLSPHLTAIEPFLFMAAMLIFTGFLTNVASNMVIVTLACTIAIPIASTLGDRISMPALCAMIGMMSAYAFATPPAMTTVVLGTGSGWTNTGDMAKYGFLTLILSCIFAIFLGYPLAALLMG